MFTSHITLHIPNTTVIQLVGDPKTDKKSANDSSAFFTLHELQKAGRCILKEQWQYFEYSPSEDWRLKTCGDQVPSIFPVQMRTVVIVCCWILNNCRLFSL